MSLSVIPSEPKSFDLDDNSLLCDAADFSAPARCFSEVPFRDGSWIVEAIVANYSTDCRGATFENSLRPMELNGGGWAGRGAPRIDTAWEKTTKKGK